MSAEELQALQREISAQVDAQAPEPTPPEILPPVDPAFAEALAQVVQGVGAIVCRKARVTAIEKREAEALGLALANLASVYDFGPKDPKAAAWLGFGFAVVGIVGNRQPLPPELPPIRDDVPAPHAGMVVNG